MSREVSEETFSALEFLQPMCAERYGVAPCTAALGTTGAHKCHNTRVTCQDPDNYNPSDTVVLRFVRSQELPLSYGPFIPALRSLKVAPGGINFAGMERGISPFGQREEVTATLADFKHSGHQLDPYRLERQTGDASLLDSGDAQAGTSDTLTLKADAPESFAGTPIVRLVAGPGSVQERPLLSFDGTTKVATVSPNWNAQYLDLPGTGGNYASTPDSAAVSITGDIDIRVKVALDDWTPVAINALVAKWASPNNSYLFRVAVGGALAFFISLNGTGNVGAGSTASPTVSDGEPLWLRVTRVQSSGIVTFYTSADGLSWAQLGDTAIISVGSAIFDGTATLEVGAQATGAANPLAGQAYYAELRNGIDGTVVAKFDPLNDGGKIGDTSFTSSTGEVWTINQSGSPAAELDGPPDATTDYEIRDAFDPYERGTFIGKWLARNPYYGNYRARWRRGRVGQALEDMHVRHYVVNNISGPSEGGAWSVKLRDLFSKVEARKAVFPLPSVGKLSADLTGSPGTFDVVPAGIGNTAENEGGYAHLTAGWVRIGAEAIQVTRSGDTFTVVGRGALGTDAEDHDEDDLVQAVGALSAEVPHEHIYTLLTSYSGVPAANIPKAEWDTHMAGYPNTYLTWVTEPTPVETLSGEIQEQAGLSVWHDPETDEIKLRRQRPEAAAPTVNDDGWLMRGSLKPGRQEAKRASRVMMYFGMRNYTRDLDDARNFHQRVLVPDLASEGSDQHGSLSLRKIFSRWIVAGGLQSATDTATRIASIFRDPPREASFDLFATRSGQLALAQPFTLQTNQIQDKDTGLAQAVTMVPTRLFEDEHAISVQAQELKFAIDLGDPNVREITISTTLYNVNLRTMHDSLFAPLTGVEEVTFTIETSGEGVSTSTGLIAIDSGEWPAMTTRPTLVIIGRGQGKGGVGGDSVLNGNGNPGGDGGVALKVRAAFTLDGTGKLWGGSGGGGAGGGGIDEGFSVGGTAGGGGAGTDPGAGGDYPGGSFPADGQPGTADAGGAAGTSGNPNIGKGGNGGDPGQNGIAGTNGSLGKLGGAAGAAGAAIDGVSLVTFAGGHSLDIRGPQIN
jgi:hypothetical protein